MNEKSSGAVKKPTDDDCGTTYKFIVETPGLLSPTVYRNLKCVLNVKTLSAT